MEFRKIGSRIAGTPGAVGNGLALSILVIIGMSHFLNDMIQSVVPAIYPILKEKYQFSFSQIGLITLVFQMTSSLLQPVTGFYADKHPRPYSLSAGMCFTLAGLLILAFAGGSVNTLVLFYAYAYSYTQIINMYDIAIEIMQGISASLGVVLTVPFVSAVAAWMISRTADSTCRDRGKPQDGNLI